MNDDELILWIVLNNYSLEMTSKSFPELELANYKLMK